LMYGDGFIALCIPVGDALMYGDGFIALCIPVGDAFPIGKMIIDSLHPCRGCISYRENDY